MTGPTKANPANPAKETPESKLRTQRPTRPGPSFFSLVPDPRNPGESYNPFPMQKKIHYSKALYRVACLGRQVGKSELASVEAAFELTANIGSAGWIVAPVFEQAQVIFKRTLEKVEAIAELMPHLKVKSKKGATLEIEVTHYDRPHTQRGAKIVGRSHFNGKSGSAPDNLRGATLTYLIIDETAMMDEAVWFEALKPMLSTTQGWVLFVSTPKGFNWFYEIYEKGQSLDEENVAWESFRAPSWVANPTVPLEYYESEKKVLPDLEFRQEYGAEFVSNSGSVFQGVDSCPKLLVHPRLSSYTEGRVQAKPVNPRDRYVIGADFGRLQDYTVFTVLNLDKREMVASYRVPYIDWDRQLELLKSVSIEWNNAMVVGDNNGVGDYLEQQALKMGIPFKGLKFTGAQVKSEVINHLAIALERGYLAIIDDPDLLKELRLFKYQRTQSGQLKMQAEGRAHDDRVVSLALAYSQFEQVGTLIAPDGRSDMGDDLHQQVLRSFEKTQAIDSLYGSSPDALPDALGGRLDNPYAGVFSELDQINNSLSEF